MSQRKMFPEYLNLAISLSKYIRTPTNNSAERTHGSVGCKSTHFTRSDLPPAFERRCMNLQHPYRAESRFLISNLLQDDILERLILETHRSGMSTATASCVDIYVAGWIQNSTSAAEAGSRICRRDGAPTGPDLVRVEDPFWVRRSAKFHRVSASCGRARLGARSLPEAGRARSWAPARAHR